jgi:hypothetical protein
MTKKIYVLIRGKKEGPYSIQEIQEKIRKGELGLYDAAIEDGRTFLIKNLSLDSPPQTARQPVQSTEAPWSEPVASQEAPPTVVHPPSPPKIRPRSSLPKTPEPHEEPSGHFEEENLQMLFVGKRYEYYIKKWAILKIRGSSISWNWAAFIFGIGWIAYRKMYAYAFMVVGLLCLEILCELAFQIPDKISNVITFWVYILFGLYGNHWYRLHSEKRIREIVATSPPNQIQGELIKKGGTSLGSALFFTALFFGILALLVIVAEG